MSTQHHSIAKIFWPLLLEIFFTVLVGVSDTLMLYAVGHEEVAAVGTAITYISFINVSFAIFSSGILAVFTQYVGAHQPEVAQKARNLALVIDAILGILFSAVILFFGRTILELLMGNSALIEDTHQYLSIVGMGITFNALNPILGNYMRAFGHDKSPMVATLAANAVNITFNALAIYVWRAGVIGVAWATFASYAVQFILSVLLAQIHVQKVSDSAKVDYLTLFKQTLRVGLPSALENLFVVGSFAFIVTLLNNLDLSGIETAARVTIEHIARVAFVPGAALAHAASIQTGFFAGAGQFEKAQKSLNSITLVAVALSLVISVVIALTPSWILHIFTDAEQLGNEEFLAVLGWVQWCLWINVLVEIARNVNIIIGESLKTSGDAFYMGIVSAISIGLFAFFGSYYFAVVLNWGVIGVFVALTLDENFRAALFFIRWRNRKWTQKVFVQSPEIH